MTMSRKHYVAIAEVIASARPDPCMSAEYREGNESARDYIARSLAATFAVENPGFNRSRFLKACGITP